MRGSFGDKHAALNLMPRNSAGWRLSTLSMLANKARVLGHHVTQAFRSSLCFKTYFIDGAQICFPYENLGQSLGNGTQERKRHIFFCSWYIILSRRQTRGSRREHRPSRSALISNVYGRPLVLFALLLGMAFNFISTGVRRIGFKLD
jgi:hypothetical protein